MPPRGRPLEPLGPPRQVTDVPDRRLDHEIGPSMAEIVRALAGDSTMTSGFAVPGRAAARSFLLFSGMAESLRKGWLKRKRERCRPSLSIRGAPRSPRETLLVELAAALLGASCASGPTAGAGTDSSAPKPPVLRLENAIAPPRITRRTDGDSEPGVVVPQGDDRRQDQK